MFWFQTFTRVSQLNHIFFVKIIFLSFYRPFKTSWATAFNSVPFMCFALQCHIAAIPIFASLKTRTLKNFLAIICAGVFICITVYSVTGVFGLLTFSGTRDEPINSDILRNYCPTDIAISIARGTLVLSLITSYPIISFCGR